MSGQLLQKGGHGEHRGGRRKGCTQEPSLAGHKAVPVSAQRSRWQEAQQHGNWVESERITVFSLTLDFL